MKRLAFFILLFGGGLYLLVYLSGKQREERIALLDAEQDQRLGEETVPALPFTPIPQATGQGPNGQSTESKTQSGVTVALSGLYEATLRQIEEPRNKRYDIVLDDVKHRGNNYYDVTGLLFDAFDPETGELTSTFAAKTGAVLIEYDSFGRFDMGRSERVQLKDVTVTMHQGSPMAPLEMTLPRAELDLITGSLYSEDSVVIKGEGIEGHGVGLELLERGRSFSLLQEGKVFLRTDDAKEAQLVAAPGGRIDFSRRLTRDDLEHIELNLPGGGQLIAEGENPVRVSGNELTLDGRIQNVAIKTSTSTTIKRVFRTEYAKLVGDARFVRGPELVTGGVAEIFFDALGEVRRLTMANDPVASGVFEFDFDGDGVQTPLPVEVRGVGPMELEYNPSSPAAEFVLPGPSRLHAPDLDFELDAETGIRGSFWGRGLAGLSLLGAVKGHLKDMNFEGSDVNLRGSQSTDEAQHLYFETKKPAHLHGPDERGRMLDVRTGDMLRMELFDQATRVLLARQVQLEWSDEIPTTASAETLKDFDLNTNSFTASGGVDFAGALGAGSGARVIAHSQEHLELFGDSEVPAVYTLDAQQQEKMDFGQIRAQHIEIEPSGALADGDVKIRFDGEGQRQELDCGSFNLELLGERRENESTPFEFRASNITRAEMSGPEVHNTFVAESVSGHGRLMETKGEPATMELLDMQARGDVRVTHRGEGGDFKGQGARVSWTRDGRGRLEAKAGERVEARGRFQEEGLPYILTATWIEFSESEVQALFPEFTLDRPAALPQILGGRTKTELHSGRAEWMTADAAGLLLAGKAHFFGKTSKGQDIELDAGSMHVLRLPDGTSRTQGIDELVAWDGFTLKMGKELQSSGEILEAGFRVLRMEGRPARLDLHGFVWHSNNIEYDVPNVLVTAGQGRLSGTAENGAESWVATYESLQPFADEDSTIMVLRNPVMTTGNKVLRAKWGTFWLDRNEWLLKTKLWLEGEDPNQVELPPGPDPGPGFPVAKAPTLFGRFDSESISKVLKEVYYEGDIEYYVDDKLTARMQAAYVDMTDGHGWIQGAEMFAELKVGGRPTSLVVRADWLRHSADGSLSADLATVTSCGYASPHFSINTNNLRLTPAGERGSVWDILLKDNSLVFDNGISIPLPRVNYKSDGKGQPTFSGMRFGDSARYGSFVEASVNVDTSNSLKGVVAGVTGVPKKDIRSRYRLKASLYGSRGLLLDQRFRVTAAEKFWANVYVESIYDSGIDRGLLRSKGEGSKDAMRWVMTTQSRYNLDDAEWFDFAFTTQSDAGVQAEFSERQFVHYERRDNFLRWRQADNQNYYSAELRYRANSFRNEVERLPDFGFLRGLTPVGELWGQPLLYGASTNAALLRSRESQGGNFSPFDPALDSGIGNRDVLRLDTRHRVEAPFELGLMGMRVSPYVGVVGTSWSRGVDTDRSPSRGAATIGIETQSTFYRTWSHGVVNTLTPYAGVRGDVADFDEGGNPMRLDPLDESVTGRFLDVGLRSRWRVPGGARFMDVAVRATHGSNQANGVADGWRPVQVLGDVLGVFQGVPFAVTHDANYDMKTGVSARTLTALSLLPWRAVGLEVAYNRGLQDSGERLYDAVSLGARWDATPKWQFEARHSLSRLQNQALFSNFVFRRVGHDFLFELNYSYRSGEGGSTFSFKYRPLLGWRSPTFGRMQTLQAARL